MFTERLQAGCAASVPMSSRAPGFWWRFKYAFSMKEKRREDGKEGGNERQKGEGGGESY